MLSAIGRTLSALGRAEQAVDFHEQAAETCRGFPDRFLLAEALSYFADTLDLLDRADDSATVRTEAIGLLNGYTDRRSGALRERLSSSMMN